MTRQEYHDIMAQLDAADVQDDVSRVHIEQLKHDVRQVIGAGDSSHEDHHATLRERVEDAAVHFDVVYPELAQILRRFVDFLSQSGV